MLAYDMHAYWLAKVSILSVICFPGQLSLSITASSGSFHTSTNASFYDILPAAVNAHPMCDSIRYGQDLDRNSCEDALHRIGSSLNQVTVAPRGLRRRPDIILPHRWSSCEYYTLEIAFGSYSKAKVSWVVFANGQSSEC